MDTIFALASAQGKAGVSVVRVSGSQAAQMCLELAGDVPPARVACVRKLHDADGVFLDEALVLFFAEGASFTGEAIVEFHVHGSIAVVKAVMAALDRFDGCRLAHPGEFTRRAMDNERLDLTQVEALSDLIEAETEAQRRLALEGMTGAFKQVVARWRDQLVQAVALLEVTIDFADEEVPVDVTPMVLDFLDPVISEMKAQIEGFAAAERIRTGFEVAIVGPPNAGKSTLLNYLAGRDAALTSERAGTTRDVLEVRMDIDGLAVTLLDTAGIRETDDVVEKLGVERALARAEASDLRVHLLPEGVLSAVSIDEGDIVVRAMQDEPGQMFGVSGLTGQGVSRLVAEISSTLQQKSAGAGLASHMRQKTALINGLEGLVSVRRDVALGNQDVDLVSEDLRSALRSLEILVGLVGVEDVLGSVFSTFCIGK